VSMFNNFVSSSTAFREKKLNCFVLFSIVVLYLQPRKQHAAVVQHVVLHSIRGLACKYSKNLLETNNLALFTGGQGTNRPNKLLRLFQASHTSLILLF
jgi:hypothetical protein